MNEYQRRKLSVQRKAEQFIYNCNMGILYSVYDISRIKAYFARQAKKYGLIHVFREAKII